MVSRGKNKPNLSTWVKAALAYAGMSQAELGRRLADRFKGFDRSMVQKMTGNTRKVSADEMLAIAEITGYPALREPLHDTTHHGTGGALLPNASTTQTGNEKTAQATGNARWVGTVEGFGLIRVRGRAMGGKDGELIFSVSQDDTVDVVDSPPRLSNVPDAYAVYLVGDSMLPFGPGWTAYVHPHLPNRRGDYVLIQSEPDSTGTISVWVKKFISHDDKTLKVEQVNPKKIITMPSRKVAHVHRVVMFAPPR